MSISNENIEINNFILNYSSEVPSIIDRAKGLEAGNMLIHIASYIHNTVLVQNLKRELTKIFPNAEIILLKHESKSQTFLTIFNLKKDTYNKDISNEILRKLHLDSGSKDISIKEYRNQLFNRYFTDHLTNLPNIYQLRKDLQENEEFGLVILNIDNFQTINNFYGRGLCY